MNLRVLGFLALAGCMAGRGARADEPDPGALRVADLKCEFASDPTGIDVAQPRLSWTVASGARGERQSAWEVAVASSAAALAAGAADRWDSGRVASGQSVFVPYGGRPLTSSEQVFWRVRAWDREGRPTPWSQPATWTMGLLAAADWQGTWIAAPGATESLLLRREFSIRPGLRRALVAVCGLGQYELFCDGAKAGDDLLSPGWTNYDRTTLYDTRDVTAQLHEGRNALGLMLGNGMYDVVRRNRFVKFTGSFGALRAILQLRLEYADGTVQFVVTDPAWRSLAGPITFGNIYSGEDYDARLEPAGWSRPDFDDRAWAPVVPVILTGDTLRGESVSAEPLRAIETRQPVAVRTFPDGSAVYDLGQNTSYLPRIRVSGPSGARVRLTPAEVVNPDGTINRNTMDGKNRGPAWWQYTKATSDEETWFPHFFYVGCRYLKVECFAPDADEPGPPGGARPRLAALEGVMVHSSAAPVGRFATSNDLLNRIRGLVRWAQCSNMVSILTDCPHREKLGWLEQYHLNGPAIRYEFDVTRIFGKGEHDMADAQTDEGLVPNIAPEYVKFAGAFRSAAEWGAAFILVPWQQYEFTGDVDLLRNNYPAMRRYFAYLETRAQDDILSDGLGDWYDLGPAPPGPAQLTPPPVTASAFYYQDAALLGQMAGVLGRADEAADYAARASRIRASYNRHFFHADTGSYATGSQCANALPLVMGIVEPAERSRVFAALVDEVGRRGVTMTTGDIGYRYLLRALAEGGRSDLIYRMIDQDEKPGYGFQLKQGATSLTEAWDANLNSSQDHFMLGQITEWFYRDLAGIADDPAGPGFQRILVQPHPVGDLAWVEASYDSVHGPIAVRWTHAGGKFGLEIAIPANTTATVMLPARAGTAIAEGGIAVEKAAGVTFLRRDGDRAVLAVESGRYAFTSQF